MKNETHTVINIAKLVIYSQQVSDQCEGVSELFVGVVGCGGLWHRYIRNLRFISSFL